MFFMCADFVTYGLSVETLSFELSRPVCHSQLGSMNVYLKFIFNNRKINPSFIDVSVFYVGFALH